MGSWGWIFVWCLFRSLLDGQQVYEERITLWRATGAKEATVLAETEALTTIRTRPGPDLCRGAPPAEDHW